MNSAQFGDCKYTSKNQLWDVYKSIMLLCALCGLNKWGNYKFELNVHTSLFCDGLALFQTSGWTVSNYTRTFSSEASRQCYKRNYFSPLTKILPFVPYRFRFVSLLFILNAYRLLYRNDSWTMKHPYNALNTNTIYFVVECRFEHFLFFSTP